MIQIEPTKLQAEVDALKRLQAEAAAAAKARFEQELLGENARP